MGYGYQENSGCCGCRGAGNCTKGNFMLPAHTTEHTTEQLTHMTTQEQNVFRSFSTAPCGAIRKVYF